MKQSWLSIFETAREIERLAARLGVTRQQARAIAHTIVSQRIPRDVRAQVAARLGEPGYVDPVIRAVHDHLHTLDPDHTPPLDMIRVAPLDHPVAAFVPPATIVVSSRSAHYRAAKAGDLTPLASVLVHEHAHMVHGPSERPAQDAEAEFLRQHAKK